MTIKETRHDDGSVTDFQWPAAVSMEPVYPELEPMRLDLAGDTVAPTKDEPQLRLVHG